MNEIQEENNFLHLELEKQIQMARALKAGVYGQHHHAVKKNKKRLWEIFHPKHPHR